MRHAQLIAVALTELAEAANTQVASETEAPLVELARQLDPLDFARALAGVRQALAPEADEKAGQRRCGVRPAAQVLA